MTYTYAILDVPRAVYAAVRALLDAADYGHEQEFCADCWPKHERDQHKE